MATSSLYLIDGVPAMPQPNDFSKLDFLAIQLGHDLGLPLLREAAKLFCDVDGSMPSSLRACSIASRYR
jgi:hypothetical protein